MKRQPTTMLKRMSETKAVEKEKGETILTRNGLAFRHGEELKRKFVEPKQERLAMRDSLETRRGNAMRSCSSSRTWPEKKRPARRRKRRHSRNQRNKSERSSRNFSRRSGREDKEHFVERKDDGDREGHLELEEDDFRGSGQDRELLSVSQGRRGPGPRRERWIKLARWWRQLEAAQQCGGPQRI